jgi:hypothetical protein
MVDAAWIPLTFNANARRVAGERMKHMRKKVIALSAMPTAEQVEVEWLNLGNLAHVEVTRRVLIFRLSPSSGSETGRAGALQNRSTAHPDRLR